VTNTQNKDDHITPILQKLHWLPGRQRIHIRILLTTYVSVNNMAPEYLCELVSIRYYCSCQCLGSSHMVIVRLVLQPPLILEMHRPLNFLSVLINTPVQCRFQR